MLRIRDLRSIDGIAMEDRKPERERRRDEDAELAAAIALTITDLAH